MLVLNTCGSMWRCVGTFGYVSLQLNASACNLATATASRVAVLGGMLAARARSADNFHAECLRIMTVMLLERHDMMGTSMQNYRWHYRPGPFQEHLWTLSPCNTAVVC